MISLILLALFALSDREGAIAPGRLCIGVICKRQTMLPAHAVCLLVASNMQPCSTPAVFPELELTIASLLHRPLYIMGSQAVLRIDVHICMEAERGQL